jgi:hypothetical protein
MNRDTPDRRSAEPLGESQRGIEALDMNAQWLAGSGSGWSIGQSSTPFTDW